MKDYHWLLFDADDTLLDFLRSEHDALAETLSGAGLPAGEDVISVYSGINAALWKKLELGQIRKERLRFQRFEELCAHYGWETDAAALAETYALRLSEKSYVLPGAVECCRALSATGKYEMYVITNGIRSIQKARFGASAVKPFFLRSFISDEIGADKPSRAFFDAVAAAIPGFDRTRALVIGDSLTSDIRGGREYGIDTCWFNRRGAEVPSDGSITYVINDISHLPALLAGLRENIDSSEDRKMTEKTDYSPILAELERREIAYATDCALAPYSSFRIGGPADLCVFPASEEQLVAAEAILFRADIRTFTAGNASDLVFDDAGFRGAVVFTTRVKGIRADGCRLTAACGENLSDVAEAARDLSLTGLEFSFGIPGAVGGAAFMNAGAYGGNMSDVIASVRAYDRITGEIVTVSGDQLDYAYRHSYFTDHPELIILSAEYALAPGDRAAIAALMEKNITSRRQKQPLEWPSAGSVFKRPAGNVFVGPMIQDAGLKGTRVGGAEVSRKHAGFIINACGATAADVRDLVALVRRVILEKYGYDLECEIRYIPAE